MEMNKIFPFLGLSGGENQYSLGVDKCLLLLALNTEIELSHINKQNLGQRQTTVFTPGGS